MCGEDLDWETASPADIAHHAMTSPWWPEKFTGSFSVYCERDHLSDTMTYYFEEDKLVSMVVSAGTC